MTIILDVLIGLTAVSAGWHAWLEWRGGLNAYLAQALRWPELSSRRVGLGLLGAALLLHLAPLAAALALPVPLAWVAVLVSATRLADLTTTHLIPTLATGRRAPGLETLPVDVLVVGVWAWMAPAAWWLGVAGLASFGLLWPALAFARRWAAAPRRPDGIIDSSGRWFSRDADY